MQIPVCENLPMGHDTHTDCPGMSVVVPGGQNEHDELPADGWYEPTGHSEQVAALGLALKVPAPHGKLITQQKTRLQTMRKKMRL
jgi:hypothetical protein